VEIQNRSQGKDLCCANRWVSRGTYQFVPQRPQHFSPTTRIAAALRRPAMTGRLGVYPRPVAGFPFTTSSRLYRRETCDWYSGWLYHLVDPRTIQWIVNSSTRCGFSRSPNSEILKIWLPKIFSVFSESRDGRRLGWFPNSRGAVDGRSSRIPGKNKGARFHVQTRLVFAP